VDASEGAVAASLDLVVGLTPVDPAYPNGGSFVVAATTVARPTNSQRFKISIPACTNYTFEVYGNPTLANLGSGSTNLDSSYLTNMSWVRCRLRCRRTGALNTNKFTASSNGTLSLYLKEKAVKGFYYICFGRAGCEYGNAMRTCLDHLFLGPKVDAMIVKSRLRVMRAKPIFRTRQTGFSKRSRCWNLPVVGILILIRGSVSVLAVRESPFPWLSNRGAGKRRRSFLKN
jgi:hypothetical protein